MYNSTISPSKPRKFVDHGPITDQGRPITHVYKLPNCTAVLAHGEKERERGEEREGKGIASMLAKYEESLFQEYMPS